MTGFLIHSYQFDAQGVPTKRSSDILAASDAAFTWMHLDANEEESRALVETGDQKLDELIVDALMADETRPRAVVHAEGVMLIVRSVNRGADGQVEDMTSLRFWVDAKRVVSVQRRPSAVVDFMQSQLENGKNVKGPGAFLLYMLWHLFEDMGDAIAEISNDLDELEELILENPLSLDHKDISLLRKKIIQLQRFVSPHGAAISGFKAFELSWLSKRQRRHLQECLDLITKHIEHLHSIRERSQVVSDEVANVFARKMNQNVYLLSLIAAVFMPLSFLTGLFGINVGGMPGANIESAFWLFCGGLAGVFVIQSLVFLKMRLFK